MQMCIGYSSHITYGGINMSVSKKRNRSVSKPRTSQAISPVTSDTSRKKKGLLGGLGLNLGNFNFGSIKTKVSETNQFLQELNSVITTADHLRGYVGAFAKKETAEKQELQHGHNFPNFVRRGDKPPQW